MPERLQFRTTGSFAPNDGFDFTPMPNGVFIDAISAGCSMSSLGLTREQTEQLRDLLNEILT